MGASGDSQGMDDSMDGGILVYDGGQQVYADINQIYGEQQVSL